MRSQNKTKHLNNFAAAAEAKKVFRPTTEMWTIYYTAIFFQFQENVLTNSTLYLGITPVSCERLTQCGHYGIHLRNIEPDLHKNALMTIE